MTESQLTEAAPAAADPALAAVADARRRLERLDEVGVSGHAAVYDEVHGLLQTTLAGLDER